MSFNKGISCRQGPHQEAQKLIITTWPFKSDSFTFSPSRVVRAKSGAGPDNSFACRATLNKHAKITVMICFIKHLFTVSIKRTRSILYGLQYSEFFSVHQRVRAP